MRFFMVCADRGIAPDGTKGASVHLRSLALALQRAGHDVTIFAARPCEGHGDIGLRVLPLRDAGDLLRAVAELGAPDVVYERYSLGSLDGLETARHLDRPFVLEVNAPLVAEARRHRPQSLRPGHAAAEERLFTEADVVIAVSSGVAAHVTGRGGRAMTAVVPNGCELRGVATPALGPPVLGFLGHPKPWHGAERLPAILASLVDRGHDARLLVIGGGPGTEPVRAAADAAGVSARVEVTGAVPHEEVAQLLATVTIGVAPYPPQDDFYFCPIKVVEYLAAGLPIVASDLGDIAMLVDDAGLLVDAGDDEGFVSAIAHLLEHPAARRAMGRAGRGRAERQLTWDAAAAAVVAAVSRTPVGGWV